MKYPTTVKVRDTLYKIEYVNTSREVSTNLDSDLYCGMANHVNRTIRILINRPSNAILETLIHELLHCITERNPALLTLLGDDKEESIVSTFAIDLAMLLLDNKWVNMPKQDPTSTRRIK